MRRFGTEQEPTSNGEGSGGEVDRSQASGCQLRIDDPGAASELVSRAYLPVRVTPPRDHHGFLMGLTEVRMNRMTAGIVSLDTPARLTSSMAENVHLNLTLHGRSVWRGHGADPIVADAGSGALYNPGQAADSLWSEACEQLCLMIPPEVLETELETLTGRSLRAPLHFVPELSLDGGLTRLLTPTLRLLAAELHHPNSAVHLPATGRHVEGLVLDGLLLGQRHSHSDLLHRPAPAAPGPIARAVELIQEDPELPWTSVGLASEVHLSVRALQDGFRRWHGQTPMTYLRDVRLRAVHQVLTAARPGTVRVQDVALRFGLMHPGRFSTCYREKFGESPSATLAREPF
ncbi:MAG TPA: AraC family transcriptional regulator [Nocardioides sp.]|nr:AraC family transcriptional regulator [Nocardioides sp.]